MSVKGMVVVMTFSVIAWKSLGLKWTTEELHTNCCEGQDKILMWNYSLEKNETVQNIRWFFNLSTAIAYDSESIKFLVPPLYMGRVEQIGKTGILLKNVSSVDTGNYSLYLNLGPESPENMQTIFLTVFEAPTYQCKPSITNYSGNVIYCSTNSCGGIQLSTEWRISEKYDFVSNESYLKINSSWNAELVSCCLHRQNMQCQNGNLLDFCASTIIFFAEDKHVPDSKYTENSMNLTPAVIVLATTTFLSIVVICFSYRKRIRRLYYLRRNFPTRMGVTESKLEDILSCDGEVLSDIDNAKRCKDQDMARNPNMEPEARPLMGGVRRMDAIMRQELERKACLKGEMRNKDAFERLERKLEAEFQDYLRHNFPSRSFDSRTGLFSVDGSRLSGDAKRCKDQDMARKPNMEPEARPLMGGVRRMDAIMRQELERKACLKGKMRNKDAFERLERKLEAEFQDYLRHNFPSRSSETSRTILFYDARSNLTEGIVM